MRTSRGLALVAVGAIMLLAVKIPIPFLSLKVTGLVLVMAGLAGLRIPQLALEWLERYQEQLTAAFPPVTDADDGPRLPLDSLLYPWPEPAPAAPVPADGVAAPGFADAVSLSGGLSD